MSRISALGPYLRAQLASEEAFDNAGGVRFDNESGPCPHDRKQPPVVVKVARAVAEPEPEPEPEPVVVAAPKLKRVRAMSMADGCQQDIVDTGRFHKRSRKYHG